MALLRQVFEPQPVGPPAGELSPTERGRRDGGRLSVVFSASRRAPELGVLIALAALLNLWALGRNHWANTYYSAAVRSMAASWHNFFYVSLDPSGVMSVDKPPLSLWIQTLSVRVFGYHPLAIMVPQALMGIASVVLVYDLVRRRFGRIGGFVAGLALATTPIAVAMSRDNNPDALLTLCSLAAIWFAVRASEDGRMRWLVYSGIAVGLGFEAKMGAALFVLPAIVIATLWVAPRGRLVALRQLLAGGVAMVVVGGAWPLAVALTPAADRPWVSGTSDNSIFSLITGYNGLGRVSGQSGAPATAGNSASSFGAGDVSPFRLLNASLGGQAGWLVGLAVVGGLAVLMSCRARRSDPRTAWIILVGGMFAVTAAVFSYAQGIFHPYYVVLLAPFTAALVGAGVATMLEGGRSATFAAAAALTLGVICEFVVLNDYGGQLTWMHIALPALCAGAAASVLVYRRPSVRLWALGIGAAALLVAPTIWSFDTLGYANNSTFPTGGPASANANFTGPGGGAFGGPGRRFARGGGFGGGFAGGGGVPGGQGLFGGGFPSGGAGAGGSSFGATSLPSGVESYVASHGGGTIAVASQSTAADAIIDHDYKVAGVGGFTGQESDPTIPWFADEVASGHIRWVVFSQIVRTGNGTPRAGATRVLGAAMAACKPVTAVSSTFYDCAGRAAALRKLVS